MGSFFAVWVFGSLIMDGALFQGRLSALSEGLDSLLTQLFKELGGLKRDE